MTKPIDMPVLRDSGRFKMVGLPPQGKTYHVALPPAKPPFRAVFSIKTIEIKDPNLRRIIEGGQKLVESHLAGERWVHPDGSIRQGPHQLTDEQIALARAQAPIEISIDFGFVPTEMCSMHMPESLEGVNRLSSGFPCETWRLCLSRPGNEEWHDHILFENGQFLLQSILIENEEFAGTANP